VTLDRPPRAPARAITDRVRGAILAEGDRLGLQSPALLATHVRAEHVAHARDLFADVEERYQMHTGSLLTAVVARMFGDTIWKHPSMVSMATQQVFGEPGARHILLELPDAEFLMVLEHAVGDSPPAYVESTMAAGLLVSADNALGASGCAYRLQHGNWPHFTWIGDAKQHALTIEPALLALADARLQGGPRDDFERALRKRRAGATKDLEDAIIAAAKAVESVLKVLYDEHGVKKPAKHELAGLFNDLARPEVAVLPGYVQQLVLAVGGRRNHMAGHGPGSDVRDVPEDLADASIAAAATAITYLAHQLP
jgi:HEPN domain-containing protein